MNLDKKVLVINANAEIKSIFVYLVPEEILVFKASLDDAAQLLNSPNKLAGIFMRPYSQNCISQLAQIQTENIHVTLLGDSLVDLEKMDRVRMIDPYKEKLQLKATIQQILPTQGNTEKDKLQLLGTSAEIEHIRRMIHKVATLDSTILITGETGTGKEVVARLIHTTSQAQQNRFVAVHSAGIPETLLESTLFGHEKGAFTGAYKMQKGYFESANNGTIFLDEIGETSMTMQVKLLRVLQEHTFIRVGDIEPIRTNARVIAATNKNLNELVNEQKFREDLYYRLNVISIELPPLRDRIEDIPILAMHFLRKFAQKHNRPGIYIKPETMDLMKSYHWPGNVRELENLIDRLVALSDSDWITPDDLPIEFRQQVVVTSNFIAKDVPITTYVEAKSAFEKEYIIKLLNTTNGNISEAARVAQMPRQNLHVKIKKYNLNVKRIHVDASYFSAESLN